MDASCHPGLTIKVVVCGTEFSVTIKLAESLKSCTIEEQSLNRSPIANVEDDSKNSSFYIGMGVGFATGFWAICGALFFNRTWRHAYFRFADEIKDWIYVTAMRKMNLLEKLRVHLSK